jgi:mannosyl-3-phosphoglycerate phosphatase family protein
LLAPRQLVFSALEGALVDARTDSFSGAEEALSELHRRNIPFILLSPRTRAEVEPVRRKLEHNHPFITENGGGVFFPDGYFNLRIPGAVRVGRYFCIAQGRPYDEVCDTLNEVAQECGVGVTGFRDMNAREISANMGLRPRAAGLARDREFEELFFFTSADAVAIARFVAAARERGFDARPGSTFWRFSSGCDTGRAVRVVAQLFRQATRLKLRLIGIGAGNEDLPWLQAMDQAILLSGSQRSEETTSDATQIRPQARKVTKIESTGAAGWAQAIFNIIS